MSTEYGEVYSRPTGEPGSISVTSFFGGPEDGKCVQLTIGDTYVQLDKSGVADLIGKLMDCYR